MKTIYSVIPFLLFISCSSTKKIDYEVTQGQLQNWRAESENITNLSILLEDDGVEGSPIKFDNENILFESMKNDNYDLWLINSKGKKGIRQLTTYDGPDRQACIHPNGKNYIFLSDRSETGYYMGEIGKPTVMSLVSVKKPYFGGWTSADISPNGKEMLYVSGKYIWIFDLETKNRTQLIQGTDPRWYENGTKIIYKKIGKELSKGNYVSTSIWTMSADGTEQTEIIGGDKSNSYSGARISPNGQKILYLKRKIYFKSNGEVQLFSNSDIFICNIDGTEHTQITTHPLNDIEANWIDSETIVFCSERPQSGLLKDRTWDLWKLKIY